MKPLITIIAAAAIVSCLWAHDIDGEYQAMPSTASEKWALAGDLASALLPPEVGAMIRERVESVVVSSTATGYEVIVKNLEGSTILKKEVKAELLNDGGYRWTSNYDMHHEGTRSQGLATIVVSREGDFLVVHLKMASNKRRYLGLFGDYPTSESWRKYKEKSPNQSPEPTRSAHGSS